MGRIELPTSPLPRGCSTTEPHGQFFQIATGSLYCRLERETGIEPASLAWKARVLPLNYSRTSLSTHHSSAQRNLKSGGGDWIRTSVGVSQQIYSLPPLATRAPLRRVSNYSSTIRLGGNLSKISRIGCRGRAFEHWMRVSCRSPGRTSHAFGCAAAGQSAAAPYYPALGGNATKSQSGAGRLIWVGKGLRCRTH